MNYPMFKQFVCCLLLALLFAGPLWGESRKGRHNLIFEPEEVSGGGSFAAMQSLNPLASVDIISATEVTTEIDELARGLMHDKRLIFEFVRNEIVTIQASSI